MNPTVRVKWFTTYNGGQWNEGWLLAIADDHCFIAGDDHEIHSVSYAQVKIVRMA